MKIVLKILGALVVLIVVAVVALVVLIDPNSFKPKIESLAQGQKIALDMRGDLSWQFWPRLGFAVVDVNVAAVEAPSKPIARFNQAALGLAIKPLLSGEIHVDEILLDGARIFLELDENGKGNWESLMTSEGAPPQDQPASDREEQNKQLSLKVERLIVSDAALEFRNLKANSTVSLRDVSVELTELNTLGKPFTLALAWVFEMTQAAEQKTLALGGKINSQIEIAKDFSALQLTKGALDLQFLEANNSSVTGTFTADISGLNDKLQYLAETDVSIASVRNLLLAMEIVVETASPSVLGQAGLTTKIVGDSTSLTLDPLRLTFDQTDISGRVEVKDIETQDIIVVLNGNKINLDDYLPIPPEQETQTVAESEDTPLPLDTMRALKLDAKLTMAALTVQKLPIKNIDLDIRANNGLIKEKLLAQAYDGDIEFASTTKVGQDAAELEFQGDVAKFQIAPLLDDLALSENLQMSGAINANAKGVTRGATVSQLTQGMKAKLDFSGAQLRLSPLNIEEKFCKAVNLISQKTQTVDWADFTELKQFAGSVTWQNDIIELEKFKAGVSQLLLASTGRINLATDKYEFKLPIKFTSPEDADNYRGCALSTKNYWVDRGLSLLRCRGSLSNLQPLKDCGLDSDGLKGLTKDFAEYKLREKHGDKIDAAEQKLKDKKQELKEKKQEIKADAQGEVDEKKAEVKEKVDEKKDELFNKLKKKLNKLEDKDGK